MKLAFTVGLLWASLWAVAAQSTSSRLERASLLGNEYVRLDDWARVNGGQTHWTVPKQELKLLLPSGSLSFTVDSRKATVKGTHVWLSLPVALKNGLAYVGAVDIRSALNPVLFPARNPAGQLIRSIVLDPGHGGKDPGHEEGRRQEKEFTLSFAKELSDLLGKAGFKVSLTRKRDAFVDLPERPDIARRRGADLFLSLHFNSADAPGTSAVKGSEVYCLTPARTSSTNARGEGAGAGAFPGNRFDSKNMLLAWQIQKALSEKAGTEDRGVKRARYAVLRSAEMPAVLIEAAFMTHQADSKRIYDPAQRRQMAQAVADGILAYKKSVSSVSGP
ncbi:MAG TPA: N-acetylmuramoyl-L-alanine amidase [Candidatus Binatia bacterium]|nr:N-acetylmuramoyl-L-alanine amidase [Candidatus Binatia bacterium]